VITILAAHGENGDLAAFLIAVLIVAALLGLIPATIASNKGYDFQLWWLFGAALFIVALPMALVMCEIRTTVFSWTPTRFPFHTGSAKKLTFGQSPIITVVGKAYWDVGHAPKDQNNRRKYMPDYAVYEIHPVMKPTVLPR
jgi:hypothetical protein